MARLHPRRSAAPRTPALLAALWALAFAAASAYWAVGGTGGANTIARSLADRAAERDPGFVATLWAVAAAKAILAALALALMRPSTARFARAVRFAGWIAGGALTLYGAAGLVAFGLMALGAREVPPDIGDTAVLWYVVLWEPLWLLGGLLFLAAARQAVRTIGDQAPAARRRPPGRSSPRTRRPARTRSPGPTDSSATNSAPALSRSVAPVRHRGATSSDLRRA